MKVFIDKNGKLFDGYTCDVRDMIEVQYKEDENGVKSLYSSYNIDGTPNLEEDTRINTEVLETKAKATRDEAEISNIVVHNAEWQVKEKDKLRMKDAINTAIRQGRQDESIGWILADNSIRMSTVSDLEDVLDAVTLRTEQIFMQYTLWRSGDKSEPFEYIEEEIII